jgi:molybdenum-dependent DNA-binding transcriptional regulator ModE
MDRFEAMSIMLAVAETGSLSAAARQKKTPLATVSRKVSELEAHLHTKLFNRSSRVLVPTDAGRSYIAAAKRILADVAEAERAASGEYTTPRGDLSVSAPVTLGRLYLQPVLAEFFGNISRSRRPTRLAGPVGQSLGGGRRCRPSHRRPCRQQSDRGANRRNLSRDVCESGLSEIPWDAQIARRSVAARLHQLSADSIAINVEVQTGRD